MRFIEEMNLRNLSFSVNKSTVDQKLDSRFELYSLVDFDEVSSPKSLGSRNIATQLIAAISETYPEYSVDNLTAGSFVKRADISSVVNYVNQTLGAAVERSHPELLPELWRTVRNLISTPDVYELIEDFTDRSRLWGFHYFWVDNPAKRLLVLSCRSRSKAFRDSSSDGDLSARSWNEVISLTSEAPSKQPTSEDD